jgi:glutathione S-transferase
MDLTPVKDIINVYTYILCPYCKPVEYVLHANGIEFKRHELDLMKDENRSDEYRKINPLQRVPAIIENDFILFESNTITRYLCNSKNIADRWYPKQPNKRAMIDLYFDWHASNSSKLVKFSYTKMGWYPNLSLEEAKATSDSAFAEFEEIFLTKFNFAGSDEVSIADLALVWHLKGLISIGYDLPPRSKEYFENVVKAEPGLVESLEEFAEIRKKIFGN